MPGATPEQIASYISRVAAKADVRRLLQTAGAEAPVASESVGGGLHGAAADGVETILAGTVPSIEQSIGVEAIILPKIRPVLDVVDGDFHTDHPLWLKLNSDKAIRAALQKAIPSIGRIELPGNHQYPYGGTGFVVGDGLVMTNRHVAAIFSSGVGTRIRFRPGYRAGIDFRRELDRPTGPTFEVKKIVMVHPYWDMAILQVEGLPPAVQPLRLASGDVTIAPGSPAGAVEVAAIGYPAFDIRNDAAVENDLFRQEFGVKRLQPGTLDGRGDTESFGKILSALRHNCSTLGGNSGSAIVDLASGSVVALHFGGRYKDINYGVPASELARDPRVVDAGVRFDPPSAPAGPPPWNDWWTQADEAPASVSPASPPQRLTKRDVADGSIELVIPLHVTVRLGNAAPEVSLGARRAGEGVDAGIEKLAEPWHDGDYGARKGYDAKFLGVKVPMPQAADPDVVAHAIDGSIALDYEHFSIVMHAKRRLALFTASNVTAAAALKKPDPTHKYTRKSLSGLGDSDQEKWFADPRLDAKYQLPDVFYTRDDGAFDKGHIVRREDVAWGDSYDSLHRANGDTYHVTNCSPQVAGFNRSTLGKDNWGDLEDHVLKGASSERYCQFAGPVLDAQDETFIGAAGGGQTVRVKIPSRFWKVIVTKTAAGLASYGFLLEQDLSDVPLEEFMVPQNFARYMEPLAKLQTLTGVRFPDAVLDADQYDTSEGVEVAMRAGVARRSPAGIGV